MKKFIIALTLFFVVTSAFALMWEESSEELVGYTIVGTKTIIGWYDSNGNKGNSFEGCDYDRVIVFSDDKILTCDNYHYHYGYRPKAIILYNGIQFKMIVGDNVYTMRR